MRKLRILIVLTLTALLTFTCCVGAAPVQTGEAANDRPPAPAATPVSPLGQGWWFLVFTNGLMTQPSDQNIVATNGSSMTVAVSLVTTNTSGIFGIGNQRLSSVGYQQYNNSNGWPNRFTDVGSGNLSVGSNQPSTMQLQSYQCQQHLGLTIISWSLPIITVVPKQCIVMFSRLLLCLNRLMRQA